jgi:hypothetical protein
MNLVNVCTGFFGRVGRVHVAVTRLSVLTNSCCNFAATVGTTLYKCFKKMLWNCWSFIQKILFASTRRCLIPKWCIFFLIEFICLYNNRVTFRHLSHRKL